MIDCATFCLSYDVTLANMAAYRQYFHCASLNNDISIDLFAFFDFYFHGFVFYRESASKSATWSAPSTTQPIHHGSWTTARLPCKSVYMYIRVHFI